MELELQTREEELRGTRTQLLSAERSLLLVQVCCGPSGECSVLIVSEPLGPLLKLAWRLSGPYPTAIAHVSAQANSGVQYEAASKSAADLAAAMRQVTALQVRRPTHMPTLSPQRPFVLPSATELPLATMPSNLVHYVSFALMVFGPVRQQSCWGALERRHPGRSRGTVLCTGLKVGLKVW